MQRQKHLIEGITSLGLTSNSKFMAKLSDCMVATAGLVGAWPDCLPLDPPRRSTLVNARIRTCARCRHPMAALSLIVNINEKMDSERLVEALCVV